MTRSTQVVVLLAAIVLVLAMLLCALGLIATGTRLPGEPGRPTEAAQPPESSPSQVPTATPAAPEVAATATPRPTEVASPTVTKPPPTATAEPLPPPGLRFGLHLLLDDGRKHWLPERWPQHVQVARQIVGPGGYVVQLIRLDDLDVERWQFFLDQCAQEGLIPILRLATPFDHDNKWWEAPPKDADGQGYTEAAARFQAFLGQLRWPGEPRYAIVHNEPNRGDEWGDRPDAAEYAQYLLDVGRALHEVGITVLGPALDLYAPHSNGQPIAGYRYIDAETFLDEMATARPEAFDVIDVWASHAYPLDPFRFDPSRQEFRIDYAHGATNPKHQEPPEGIYNRGVNSYRWELWKLEQIVGPRARTLPILITESGWRHAPSQDAEARDEVHAEISFEAQSAYLDLAIRGNRGRYPELPETGWIPWREEPRLLGVVFFALGGYPKDWGHTNWVVVDEVGRIVEVYPIRLPR